MPGLRRRAPHWGWTRRDRTSFYDALTTDQLIARLDRENTVHYDALAYRFDIVLRGRRSTKFDNRLEGN